MIKDLGHHPERYINNENENAKRDGQKVWIAWTNKGIQDEAGNISEILCVGNDISQRRQADKALQESEKKFRSVTEQSPNMIFINKNRKIDYCNKKCEEIMGYTVDEFCSHNFFFFCLISPESKFALWSDF
jgi:PAS domain-containing protein